MDTLSWSSFEACTSKRLSTSPKRAAFSTVRAFPRAGRVLRGAVFPRASRACRLALSRNLSRRPRARVIFPSRRFGVSDLSSWGRAEVTRASSACVHS